MLVSACHRRTTADYARLQAACSSAVKILENRYEDARTRYDENGWKELASRFDRENTRVLMDVGSLLTNAMKVRETNAEADGLIMGAA
jgi:hypothetical protein